MPLVQNTETTPNGTPIKNVRVTITTSVPVAEQVSTTTIEGVFTTTSDTNGSWSVTLPANTTLTPTNSWYIVTRKIPKSSGGGTLVDWAIVPDAAGPFNLFDIIASNPQAPPMSESEYSFHLAAADPHPQYFNQTRGDGRYAQLGSGGGSVADASTSAKGIVQLANDLGGTATSPTVADTAVTRHTLNSMATPTGDVAMGSHKLTALANGTAANDAVNYSQLTGQNFATIAGGKKIWVQDSQPTSGLSDGDLWITKSGAVIGVYNASTVDWTTPAGATTPVPPVVPPINPTPGVGTDISADISGAIDEFFAEYVDSSGRVIQKDESPTKVTSESTSYGALMAVLQGNQARYDLIVGWAEQNLKRSVLGETRGPNLYAWLYTIGSGVTDHNWAADAEMVMVIATAQAAQIWNRQIDYDRLKVRHDDIKAFVLNTDEGRAYVASDSFQQGVTGGDGNKGHHADGGGVVWEMDPSYGIPLAARVLKAFSNDPIWDALIDGTYDVLTKITDSTGGLATSAGIPPDWFWYSTNTHDVGPIINGTNGWTYTRDTDYGYDAFRVPFWIAVDALYYSESRAKAWCGGAFKTFSTTQWGTTNKFVDVYAHDGTTTSTNQKFDRAATSYLALYAANPADPTAASIKSTWLTNIKVTNSFGTYFKDSPTDNTSRYFGNAWMILTQSAIAGSFAKLTQVAGIQGKYSSASGGGTGLTPTGPSYVPLTGAVSLWTDPNSLIASNKDNTTYFPTATARTRAAWLASIPQTLWTGPEWDATGTVVAAAKSDAVSKSQWFSVAAYGVPGRDLGGASAGGSAGAVQYQNWITAVANAIGTANCILIYEPDSIPQILQQYQAGNKTKADYDARLALMQQGIVTFRTKCPNTRIYVDSAHSAWFPDPTPLIAPLQQVQIGNAHGISVNVSNYRPDSEVMPWANSILGMLNVPYLQYVMDCGRSGGTAADAGDWENPGRLGIKWNNGGGPSAGRRFGQLPLFGGAVNGDAKCAGRLWVKRPSESDGDGPNPDNATATTGFTLNGYGAPPAGQFDPLFVWNNNVNDGDIGCGMLRLPPTPGVTGG